MSRRFDSAFARGVALIPAISLALAPIAAQSQAIGINSVVKNQVRIRSAGAQPRPAVVRQRVVLNDQVQTGTASQLQILLLDRSVFTVGPAARLTIDRFVYDPARNSRTIGADVAKGAFRFMSGRAASRSSIDVRTPVATMGIRGTIVDAVVGEEAIRIAAAEGFVGPEVGGDPETATLIVLRGPGPNTAPGTRPGQVGVTAGGVTATLDRPMRAIYIPGRGRKPIGPFDISGVGAASLQTLIIPAFAQSLSLALAAQGSGQISGGMARTVDGKASGGGTAGQAGSVARSTGLIGQWWLAPLLAAVGIGVAAASDGNGHPDSA